VSLSEEEGLHGERLMKEGKSHLNYSHYPHSSFSLVYHWPLSSTWGGAWDFLLFLRRYLICLCRVCSDWLLLCHFKWNKRWSLRVQCSIY